MALQDTDQERQDDTGSANGGTVSQGPMMKPKRKSKLLSWLVVVIVLLAMILAGLFGWLWWRDRDTGAPTGTGGEPVVQEPAEEEEQVSACPDDFTIYTNSELGVQFCYPTAWGTPSVADGKFDASDTGQRWTINFADNDNVHAGLVTADWTTTVARDGTCSDPAIQTMPTVEAFSTEWVIEAAEGDGTASSATRGIQNSGTTLLISEYVDNLLTNGVCLNGYKVIDNEQYPVVGASYAVEFNETVTSPQQHVDNPETLLSAAERENFATFVESINSVNDAE